MKVVVKGGQLQVFPDQLPEPDRAAFLALAVAELQQVVKQLSPTIVLQYDISKHSELAAVVQKVKQLQAAVAGIATSKT